VGRPHDLRSNTNSVRPRTWDGDPFDAFTIETQLVSFVAETNCRAEDKAFSEAELYGWAIPLPNTANLKTRTQKRELKNAKLKTQS